MALKGFKKFAKWLEEKLSLKQSALTIKIAQKGPTGKNQKIRCLLSCEHVHDVLEGHSDGSWKRTSFFRILEDRQHGGWAPSTDRSLGEVAIVDNGIGGGGGGGTMDGRGSLQTVSGYPHWH